MELDKVKVLALNLMLEYKLPKKCWTFEFTRSKRTFGWCDSTNKIISLSKHLSLLNDEPQIRNTILHEIAHALVGAKHGHNHYWLRVAQSIGCDGQRCYSNDEVVTPPRKFKGTCPECGYTVRKHKRGNYACKVCCNKHNGGNYDEKYKFIWRLNDEL